jgi:hypothetical protein
MGLGDLYVGNGEIGVTFGLLPRSSNEIALLTRSMAEILIEVSAGIEVPSEHVAEGRTVAATRVVSAENPRDRPMIRIRSSASPPAATYAAVRYRDTWYWIDDGDYASKRVFTFLMIFFACRDRRQPQAPYRRCRQPRCRAAGGAVNGRQVNREGTRQPVICLRPPRQPRKFHRSSVRIDALGTQHGNANSTVEITAADQNERGRRNQAMIHRQSVSDDGVDVASRRRQPS